MQEGKKKILIRADASRQVGSGHLIRMIALGQFLHAEGYEIHFATIPYEPSMLGYLKREAFEVHYLGVDASWDSTKDLKQLLMIAHQITPAWIVLDGYQFDSEYERKIKETGSNLLRVDDVPSRHYYADIVLNQNYDAGRMEYSTEEYTKVLAGLQYVLLRRDFRTVNPFDQSRGKDRPFHILVTLGGSSKNSAELNQKIIQGFLDLDEKNMSATFIVAENNQEKVRDYREMISWPIAIKHHVGNMAEEMAGTDLAIVSCGSIMWELIYLRVPFFAVSLTPAHRDYLPRLAQKGLCVDLGWGEALSPERIRGEIERYLEERHLLSQMREKQSPVINRGELFKDLLVILEEKNQLLEI